MPTTKQRSANPKRDVLPTDPDSLLSKDEVAQLLGVTRRWVERAITRRYFPYKKVGGLVRVRRGDALAYADKRTVPARGEVA